MLGDIQHAHLDTQHIVIFGLITERDIFCLTSSHNQSELNFCLFVTKIFGFLLIHEDTILSIKFESENYLSVRQ